MVKVKGQMSDVALCIVDSDPKIKSLFILLISRLVLYFRNNVFFSICFLGQAYYLFHELSSKGNTLYNVMPDIISRLSHPDHRTSEENFQTILKFVFNIL